VPADVVELVSTTVQNLQRSTADGVTHGTPVSFVLEQVGLWAPSG